MLISSSQTVRINKRFFNIDEFHKMLSVGIFSEDDRLELIEGEIIEMTPISSRHAYYVDKITRIFFQKLSDKVGIRIQNPIKLGKYSEPQPDIALVKLPLEKYQFQHPEPEDIYLVIEVSDTSYDYDKNIKIPLYGKYGIKESWLIDINKNRIEVFRNPFKEGYKSCNIFCAKEELSPLHFPEIKIFVNEIL
jgi:Uma2 family endonuclease